MIEPTPNFDDAAANESWKHEVASRLDSFRSKSQRKLSGEFSMRFNFEGELAGPRQQLCVPKAATEAPIESLAEEVGSKIEPAAAPQHVEAVIEEQQEAPAVELPQTVPPTQPLPPPRKPSITFKRRIVMEANVIEFPRLFPPEPPPMSTLAEPVVSPAPPRILDAPEIGEPLLETPILEGLRFAPLAVAPAPEFELPLQVAPISHRLYAAFADGLIVLLATMVFAAVAYKMLPGVEWSKPMLGAAAGVPAIFWAFYQALFIVYAARTPGMAMAQLAFSTFQGTAPNRRERYRRVLGMAVSCSSLLLGFVWAFFDEDMLCWHDRMSRTYIFRERS